MSGILGTCKLGYFFTKLHVQLRNRYINLWVVRGVGY